MTAQTDLRNAMIEVLRDDLWRQVKSSPEGSFMQDNAETKVNYEGDIAYAELADAILSLLARWECKEPGDCPE